MTLERLMGLPTKQSLCLHSMYTYVATVVSPCGKSNVSVVGHQPRHVCKMLRHGPSCSRRGRPLCAAAHRAAPAVSRLVRLGAATIDGPSRLARRLAVPTQQSQAPLHRTAAAVNKLAVLGNFCPKSICDKSQFLVPTSENQFK